jgi:glycosyltransferase involved in cell wall biosynthesis
MAAGAETETSSSATRHCVMIPFLNRLDQVVDCINSLLPQATDQTLFLLVDDGSMPAAETSTVLQPVLCHPRVNLIRHPKNEGVAAARNSGLKWCREAGVEVVLMIDSDCRPEHNVLAEHLRLHAQHPDAACIGATIVGQGKGLWAKLDGLVSWVHATTHSNNPREFRAVRHPYHLATTNFSVKMSLLPQRDRVFNERLVTGEDCFLIRELRRENRGVYFSASPTVYHNDRETFRGVLRHHYMWGWHQYFIQLGSDLSDRCFNPMYRLVFFICFLPLLPLFAIAGSVLNCKPLIYKNRKDLVYYPLVLFLWLAKGVAVLEACVRPEQCLCTGRKEIAFEKAST